jgi:hypothetical protein
MKFLARLTLTFLALAVSGISQTCVDHNCGQKVEADQFKVYAAAKAKVEAFQSGEVEMTPAQVMEQVKIECDNAVLSWVRAACNDYLGLLSEKMGDKAGALTAYKEEARWAKMATLHKQTEGAKFSALAAKRIARLSKGK